MLARAVTAKESPSKKATQSSLSPKSTGHSAVEEMESEFADPKYSWTFANIPIHALDKGSRASSESQLAPMPPPLRIQAKLEVGAVDDPLEREADHVAEQVMRMPEPAAAISPEASHASAKSQAGQSIASDHGALVQRKCSCGGGCDKCKSQEPDDEHGKLQRKPDTLQISRAASSSATSGIEAPPIVHEVLRSPGQPLDAATRGFFEPRFGRILSRVRVHKNEAASEAARGLRAAAFTVGSDIVFGNNRYSPASLQGRLLLFHELRHVEQQRYATLGSDLRLDPPTSPHERDARSFSNPTVRPLTMQRVQRAPDSIFDTLLEVSGQGGLVAVVHATGQSFSGDLIGRMIFGDVGWRFLQALIEGFSSGLSKDVESGRADKTAQHLRGIFSHPMSAIAFQSGFYVGMALGLLSPIIDLVTAIISAVELSISALDWLKKWSLAAGIAASPGRQKKIDALFMKFSGLRTEFNNALQEFGRDPKGTIEKIKSYLNDLMELAIGKARDFGAQAAHSIFDLLDEGPYALGNDIGKIIGAAIAQLLLFFFSDAIGNVVTKVASLFTRAAKAIVGKAAEFIAAIKTFAGEMLRLLRQAMKGALKIFARFGKAIAEAFEALGAIFTEIGLTEEPVAAGVGKVGGVAGTPNVMEARAVEATRKLDTKVADLYPSNVPKQLKRPEIGKAPLDEPLTAAERKLTPKQLKQKHILEEFKGRQSGDFETAKQDAGSGRGRRSTDKAGAGMSAKPKHHVFPDEYREFFESHGFLGKDDIDNFTVKLDRSAHEAVHGGGNYKIGRTTKFEWNTAVMGEALDREERALPPGQYLSKERIREIVEGLMKKYKIPRKYVPYR